MGATSILEFVVDQQSWQVRTVSDGSGALRQWHVAATRDGSVDNHDLYQASSLGVVYQTETGSDDASVAIPFNVVSKQYDLGEICRLERLFLRQDPVVDTATVTVQAMGTEYGTVSQTYTVSLNAAENRIRLHRTLIGRWAQVTLAGSFSNRPAPHDIVLEYVPFRQPRIR